MSTSQRRAMASQWPYIQRSAFDGVLLVSYYDQLSGAQT